MALDIEYVKERHPWRWVVLIIVLAIGALGWFGYNWYATGNLPISVPFAIADTSVDESNVTQTQISQYTVSQTHPRYISIPSLHLGNTRVYPADLDSNNFIKAPSNINDVSWYGKSDVPGNGGVILMEGYNKGITKNGAFANLNTLKTGDKIIVERGDGQKYTYSVVENKSMTLDEVNSGGMSLMGKSAVEGKAALNLMTFDGQWVPRLGTFDKRTMLRAVIDSTE
jgi:hypothetical protein